MSNLQNEIIQCLQYFGPMRSEEIVAKMNLRERAQPLLESVLVWELSRLVKAKSIRYENEVFASNLSIGAVS